ncbi:MAG: hypothetical protein U0350_09415 [Caldilineaceae bacterium]
MMQPEVSDELYREFLKTFQLFRDPPALTKSTLLTSGLVRQAMQNQPHLLPHQALQTVFEEVLGLLAAENQHYADLLQGRFWEGQQIEEMVAQERPLPMGKRTFSNYQRNAILTFAFLFLQAESNCRDEPLAEIKQPSMELEAAPRLAAPKALSLPAAVQITNSKRQSGWLWSPLLLLPILLLVFMNRHLAPHIGVNAQTSATPPADLGAAEILFEDNFEAGSTKWHADSNAWTIQGDANGNHFYCVNPTGDYTFALAGSTQWRDYTEQFDLKVVSTDPNGSGNLLWRVGERLYPLYFVDFFSEAQGGLSLVREAPKYTILDQALGGLPYHDWTHIRIEAHGAQVKFFVGDSKNPLLQATDPTPIQQGAIGFGAGFSKSPHTGHWELCFDNVRVTNP